MTGSVEARRAGRRADAAGDETAGSWDVADLSAHPGGGVFLAGLALEVIAGYRRALLVVMLPIGYHFLKEYQKDRLVSFHGSGPGSEGNGYQVIQSKIAVGNGGMWGRGVTKETQTHSRFLPVPHTDFIFSSFAEEHGFVGVVVVLVLYFLLLMQIVQNAQTAPDRAGMYICMGVAACCCFTCW